MVQLQPRLPRRKKKEETEEGRRQETPSGKEAPADRREGAEPEHHKRTKEKEGGVAAFGPKSRNLIIVIAAAVVLVVLVLVIMWAFPAAPPGPANVVTDSQVLAELARLQDVNSNPKYIDPADYPKTFGIYARNNLTLVEQYYCSDVCPDYGRVDLVFQGITNEQCSQAGGRSLHDLAWGGYIGCEPRVG